MWMVLVAVNFTIEVFSLVFFSTNLQGNTESTSFNVFLSVSFPVTESLS